MTCAAPVSIELLHDYFADELGAAECEALEDHVFSCDECALAFDRAAAFATALRSLIPAVISHKKLESLQRVGQRVRLTPVEPDRAVDVVFAAHLSLLVHALRADLRRAERVDLEVLDAAGRTIVGIEGVPFDRDSGEVLVACQRHYEHAFPEVGWFRLSTVEAGERKPIADYVVNHIWTEPA